MSSRKRLAGQIYPKIRKSYLFIFGKYYTKALQSIKK